MTHKILFYIILALMVSASIADPNKPYDTLSDSEKLDRLFKDHWQQTLEDNPLFATSYGDHRFDDKLPEVSLQEAKRDATQTKNYLNRLNNIDPNGLTNSQKINYRIFRSNLLDSLKSYRLNLYLMPLSQMGGFYSSFPQMHQKTRFKTAQDYRNYTSRLNAFDKYAEGYIQLMRKGIETGYVLPKIIMKDIDKSVKAHIVKDPNQSELYKPFKNFPDTIDPEKQEQLRTRGKKAITEVVIPTYEKFLRFLQSEYIPAGRNTIGISELPNGPEIYRFAIESYTNTDLSPGKIHQIGLKEVKRIRKEMLEVIQQADFDGSYKDFVEFLNTDERFYVNSAEQLLKEYSYVIKRIDGKLPEYFKKLPRMPFGLKEIPDFLANDTAIAYYMRPANDGTRPGYYYINTSDLKDQPLYNMQSLTAHETSPGHHLQIALQQELENLPEFRKFSGQTAYTEGWALYAEKLAGEMGIYNTPFSKFGHLNLEMWRACRLVVDTGIHHMGWSRQKAIEFLDKYTTLSRKYIATEIDRYIAWPGQALSYKIGEIKILELRRYAEQKLGTVFDIREFHHQILKNGSIDLRILENIIKEWVKQTSHPSGSS